MNVGTMCGRSGEVVETLTRRRIDVYRVQKIRWRGASTRMITGKDTQYKAFWVGNCTGFGGVEILLAKMWVEKVIDVDRVNDHIMLLKLLVGKKVVPIVSAYAPQQGLSVDRKDKFFETPLHTVSKIGNNEIIVLGGDLNGHVGKSEAGYGGVHGGYGYGMRNADGERIGESRVSRVE